MTNGPSVLAGVHTLLVEDPGRYLYWLDVAGARVSLQFAAEPPGLLTGARVRVRGVRIDGCAGAHDWCADPRQGRLCVLERDGHSLHVRTRGAREVGHEGTRVDRDQARSSRRAWRSTENLTRPRRARSLS